MFTGIVEDIGRVVSLEKEQENLHITIKARIAPELKVDQSVSHNGVCLTTVKVNPEAHTYTVTAVKETLDKSNLGLLMLDSEVNLERSMRVNGMIDGHIVQGHVDQTAVCTKVTEAGGSWMFYFAYENKGQITVPKGSISVDGVSLTVVDSEINTFSVAIIPYTYEHTVFHNYKPGTVINIEFDIIGKYVERLLKLHKVIPE